jgi:PAS domain S-box-containing protein
MSEDRVMHNGMHTVEDGQILVVDDAAVNLEILTELLTEQGYSVHPVSDGELALAFVQSTLPDLILLDIRMPGMDGYEVCRRLKADEGTASIPVIFISILEDEDEKVKGFQAGAVDYITKPFQAAEVLARVNTHLRLQKLTKRLDQKVRQRTEALATSNRRLRKAEADLHRLNRQLRAMSTCNQVLMQASDELSLLEEICRIVCEVAGFSMAWVGYRQDDEAEIVRPVAWAGVEADEFPAAGITRADPEGGQDPAGRAIQEGGSVCIQDLAAHPLGAHWRKHALKRGYSSCTALPLQEEGAGAAPFGVLCIYAAAPDAFSPEEIRLLEELAANLAFGIKTLRLRAAHEAANGRLFASEERFRALVENSPDFIIRYDLELRRIYANPAIQELFGGPAQDLLGKTPADGSPLCAPEAYMKHLRRAMETAAECSAEIPYHTPEGEMRWSHIRFVPEFGPGGEVVSVFSIGRDIHELKESEQGFQMLAENYPDFVVRFDRDGRHTYVNPAVEKAFGLPAEAIVGKTLHQLPQHIKPQQKDALLALICRAFDEAEANISEGRWETASGERIFEIRHIPEKDAAGNVVSVLGTARDITERRQMARERAATLRFFESLDRVNRVIQASSDLEQMMGEALDEVRSVFDCDRAFLLHPCDPQAEALKIPMESTRPEYPGVVAMGIDIPADPKVAENFRILLASDGPVRFGPGAEFPLPNDLADLFAVKSSISMALHPRQGQAWLFGLHQCDHARIWTREEERLLQEIGRRLEAALTSLLIHRDLRESEARHRRVFENSPVSIWEEDFSAIKKRFDELKQKGVSDIEAHFHRHPETVRQWAEAVRIVDLNRAALALHGAASKAQLLTGLAQIFIPETFDTFRRELVCLWQGGTEMAADTVVKTLAGERREVSLYFSVCAGHEETLSKVIVSLIDITERKQMEAELSAYRDQLEEMVRQRTTQLEAAKKELQGFTYSVSHDLRAPLRHIDGFLEMLRKKTGGALDEQGRHYMDAISGASRKMGRLIDGLLSFSQMGHHVLAFQKVDLHALVQGAIEELAPETAGRKIDWRIGDLPLVKGDASTLRMVLVNLIANALKFTRPREAARIEVGSLPGPEGGEIAVYVRDNGVGFDEAYAEKLFGVFQRMHHAEEFEGSGIGLANVRRIITRHGGRTWAEGASDQGATFFFSLPHT